MDGDDGGWVRRALPGFFSPLEVAASVPTTMARAAELAAAGAPEGATVVTEEQTEGRGRLGRAWVAPPGSSLLLSVVLRPPLPREAVWLTVAAAAVALAGAVDEVAPKAAPAGLKWPNDLELGGRKAAGLLAEAHLEGERLAAVLLGMGVNVGQEAADFPPEVAAAATSVRLAAGAPVDRADLLAAWAGRFLAGYADLCAGRPGPGAGRLPVAPAHRRPAGPGRAPGRRPGGRHRRRPDPDRRPGRPDGLRRPGRGPGRRRPPPAPGPAPSGWAVRRPLYIRRCRRSIPRCCAGPAAPGRRSPRSAACATAARPGVCAPPRAGAGPGAGRATGRRRRGPRGAAHRVAALGWPPGTASRRHGCSPPRSAAAGRWSWSSRWPGQRHPGRAPAAGCGLAGPRPRSTLSPWPRPGAAPARPADRQRGLRRPCAAREPRPPSAGGRGRVATPPAGSPRCSSTATSGRATPSGTGTPSPG